MKNVKSVFDEECSHLKFDKALAKRLSQYIISFINKNEDHMTFFGGNLTGVQVVRFTTQDKDKWFSEVLETDEFVLEEAITALPTINKNFFISSDTFNLSSVWLVHKLMNSPYLNDEEKSHAMLNAALALQFKFLTSLLYRYFRYPADPEVAAATYAQLSMKFAIKQYGNWSRTLEARCEDMYGPNSIHRDTFKRFNNDASIVYLLNDAQGRIRDMLKNIYAEFMKMNKLGKRIIATSATVELDGESILKDKTKNLTNYTRYLHSIIADKNSFIKPELQGVIEKIMSTMPPKLLNQTLEWCSHNYRQPKAKVIEDIIDLTMIHAFSYIGSNRSVIKDVSDLPGFIAKLRGVYMSSRSVDRDLLALREMGENIVKQATTTKNASVISSVKTGLLLYLVLRAFTQQHYSAK